MELVVDFVATRSRLLAVVVVVRGVMDVEVHVTVRGVDVELDVLEQLS